MELKDMTTRQGVYVNPEDRWYEWNPQTIEDNIYGIVGSLGRQLGRGFRASGTPEKHPTKDGWWVWRWK